MVQYQESDWAFLSRLLEAAGIAYSFEMTAAGERLLFCDHPEGYAILAGPAVTYQNALEDDGRQAVVTSCISRWRSVYEVVPQSVSVSDADPGRLDVPLYAEAEVAAAGVGAEALCGMGFGTPEQGARLAQLQAERWRCREKVQHGHGSCARLTAGKRFKLMGHYRPDANRTQLLTEVEHVADAQGYRCKIKSLDAETPFRPELRTPRPNLTGVVPARLEAHGDGEHAARDEHGHYRVVMPFDMRGNAEGDASAPVPLAQPYSGLDMPLPKGAQVVLASIDGNPDRLVITGAVASMQHRGHKGVIQAGSGLSLSSFRQHHARARMRPTVSGSEARRQSLAAASPSPATALSSSLVNAGRMGQVSGQLLSPRHASPSGFDTAVTEYDAAVTAYNTANTEAATAQTAYDTAVTSYNTAQTSYLTNKAAYDTAVTSHTAAQTNFDTAKAAYDTAIAGGDAVQIAAAEQALNDSQASLNTAAADVTAAESALNTSQQNVNTAGGTVASTAETLSEKQQAVNDADALVNTKAAAVNSEQQTLNNEAAEVHEHEEGSSGTGSNDTWLRFNVPHTDTKTSYLRLGEAPGDELSTFRVPDPEDSSATLLLNSSKVLTRNTTGTPKKGTAGSFAYSEVDRTIVTSGNLEMYTGGNKTEQVRGNSEETIDGNRVEVIKGNKEETIKGHLKLTIEDGTLAVYDAVAPYKLDFRETAGSWRKTEVTKVTSDTYSFGDTESYFLGYNFAATSGIDSGLFVGASVNAALGLSLNANIGADLSFDLGPRYNFTYGPSYARSKLVDSVATNEISLRVKPDTAASATAKKMATAGIIAGGVGFLVAGLAIGLTQGLTTGTDKADAGDADDVAVGSGFGVTLSAAYSAGLSAALMAMAIVDWNTPRAHAHGQTTLIIKDNSIKMITDTASIEMTRSKIRLKGEVWFYENAAAAVGTNYACMKKSLISLGRSSTKVPINMWGAGKASGTAMNWK